MAEIKDTPRSDAVVRLVKDAVMLIMNVSPADNCPGYSIIRDSHIKALADSVRNLDATLRQSLSNEYSVGEKSDG